MRAIIPKSNTLKLTNFIKELERQKTTQISINMFSKKEGKKDKNLKKKDKNLTTAADQTFKMYLQVFPEGWMMKLGKGAANLI